MPVSLRVAPLFVLGLAVALASAGAAAADWPQFRGPGSSGAVREALPTDWGEAHNLAWAVDVPGDGWSAPIVTGGKVVVTTAVPTEGGRRGPQRFEVRCYDLADGDELWTAVAAEQAPSVPTHRDNTFASETPVTDGERVYAYFGMNGVYCYTLDGEEVWRRDLGAYPMRNGWGSASSLAMEDGLLFVQIDNEEESHALALEAATGETVWRVERPDEVSNWCSPMIWRNSRRTELVLAGATVRSYEPATGEELWSMDIGGRSSSTPVAAGDVLVFGSENRTRRGGTPGGLFAVRAGASGEIDVEGPPGENGLVWARPRGSIGISSPLVVGDEIYVLPRRGAILRVHSLADGSETHRGRMRGGAAFWASPWAAGNRAYLLDDAGTTFVLATDAAGYEPIATNELPGRFWSTPALADGAIVLRSADRLYCVREATGG